MMETARLRLAIHDYWHCSAGRSERGGLNALVDRKANLPYVPGKTLKGCLREALHQMETFGALEVPPGTTEGLCGRPTGYEPDTPEALGGNRFASTAGALIVDNAELPEAWRNWAVSKAGAPVTEDLGETVHATAVTGDGQVQHGSLRGLEVMPPMTLTAPVAVRPEALPEALQDGGWFNAMNAALPLLRGVGAGRTRGLGRLTATLEPDGGDDA